MKASPPDAIGVYVHLPWCIRKCPYCDFNSHGLQGGTQLESSREKAYVQALIRDLAFEAQQQSLPPVASIFFGGGTPSLFSPQSIGSILSEIDRQLALKPDCEITLEANPGTAEAGQFAGFFEQGVNRLSIGVQSFNDRHLKSLGRIHDGKQAHQAIEMARAAGFERINLDLMYGLPEQTIREAIADTQHALAYETGHLSHYQLTLEKNTWFYKHPPGLPNPDVIWDIQQACQKDILRQYSQYEISAYALSGQQAKHNLNYWQFGDYLGLGAGAHSKLTDLDGRITRRWKRKQPDHYMRAAGRAAMYGGQNEIHAEQLPFEFAMNALRLKGGFDTHAFSLKTGLSQSVLRPILSNLEQRGLIQHDEQHIRCTELGWNFLNDTLQAFLPES